MPRWLNRFFARDFLMTNWLQTFFASEVAGGITMLALTLLALVLANSPLAETYEQFAHAPLTFHLSLEALTNEMLMPVFFLLVGMELKYEMLRGALASTSARILPLVAALGGIALPALIYLGITHGSSELGHGWAIPTATDIAFAICIVNLAGRAVPAPAKIFLLAIAIYDDLAAILIIAIFYSHGLAVAPLIAALAIAAVMAALNRTGRGPTWVILPLGVVLGILLHHAGIHTTVAGMITGLCISLQGPKAPLEKLMHTLHPIVSFIILPLFAFCSAGISFAGITPGILFAPLPLGIAVGLFIGKQLGIFGTTYAAVKLGLAETPGHIGWKTIYTVSIIAGIGFTMSLFIGQLAFTNPALNDALKIGVMAGSLLSALVGLAAARMFTPSR